MHIEILDPRVLDTRRVAFVLRLYVSESAYIDFRRCRLVASGEHGLEDPEGRRDASFYGPCRVDGEGRSRELVSLPAGLKPAIRAEVLRVLDAVR